MKKVIGLLSLIIVLGGAGCAVEPVGYTHAGMSVGVYEEYPRTYYGGEPLLSESSMAGAL